MNHRMVMYSLGSVLGVLAALLLLPAGVGLLYGEKSAWAYVITALIAGALWLCLTLAGRTKNRVIYAKEGLAIVALVWVLISAVGALPFVISGEIPSYIDAFFETVSGFTTTGASVLSHPDELSRCSMLWRSFTHWVGGMGVLVFVMAVLPNVPDRSIHILRAEMPGPTVGKILPKLKDTLKILYIIYIALTVIMAGFLMAGGMSLFESAVHAFATAGTGGFGIRPDSIGSYSPYIQWVITVFMLLFGVNFNLYYMILIKRIGGALKSRELWCYLAVVAAAGTVIAFNIRGMYSGTEETVRTSFFQVASVITTTGYSTADFNMWPDLSKGILFILMFIGGCAGSTAGGLKISRVMMLFKSAGRELKKVLHPRTVSTVRFEGKPLDESTLGSANAYFALYMICLGVIFLLLSFEPKGLETNLSAAVSCFNNIGPGLGAVGPAATYAGYSVFSKLVLSFAMLLGRLEIYPLLLALMPSTWIKK